MAVIGFHHTGVTVQDMDRVLVFHRGELRESGSHQELLALRGIYYRLYQLQYKDQEDRRSVLDENVSEEREG